MFKFELKTDEGAYKWVRSSVYCCMLAVQTLLPVCAADDIPPSLNDDDEPPSLDEEAPPELDEDVPPSIDDGLSFLALVF